MGSRKQKRLKIRALKGGKGKEADSMLQKELFYSASSRPSLLILLGVSCGERAQSKYKVYGTHVRICLQEGGEISMEHFRVGSSDFGIFLEIQYASWVFGLALKS